MKLLEHVYKPAEDTFLLLNAALNEAEENDLILELGTGSGIIAKALSERLKISKVVTTDINPYAVRYARSKGLDVIRTYLFRGLKGKFDLIIFNPPYLPMEEREIEDRWLEISWDGGDNGRKIINEFLDGVGRHLSKRGRFLLVVSSLSGMDEAIKSAEDRGFKIEIISEEKLFFERLAVVKGSL